MAQKKIDIKFNPKLFNNLYWHLEDAFNNLSLRYIWAYGGSSASKTFSVVQLTIKQMLEAKDNNSLMLRKYHVDIKDSIYADFKNIISAWGLGEYFVIQQDFIRCITGSYVRFRGLDDSEKVKGISGFKRVILEEVSQFDLEDFKQLRKRLRGRMGQQLVGIFNPISEEHWIKKDIFDKESLIDCESNICNKQINKSGNLVIFKTNYLDNPYIVGPYFLDKHVIEDFEKDKENDYDYYLIYALGEWGKLRTGGEFCFSFDAKKHIGNCVINTTYPTYLSFDFNRNPICCSVIQHYDATIKVVETIKLANSNIYKLCQYIKNKYEKCLFIVTGDATGKASNAMVQDNMNYFTIIRTELFLSAGQMRVPGVNPTMEENQVLVNAILQRYSVIMDATNASSLIYDCKFVEMGADGKIKKGDREDPKQQADALDTFRYYLNTFHKGFIKI